LTHALIGESGGLFLARANLAAYYPKSFVYLLFPSSPPPGWVIDMALRLARISTLCAIAGLATRPAMVASVVSCTFLAALQYSWEPLWSHPYNGGLLAGLGFMFGRAGDMLSADSLIARFLLRRPISTDREVYWWPVMLGLFGTSVVSFGGFYAKLSSPGFTFDLAWIFSDNLRNSVALPWLIFGLPLPPIPKLIVDHEWIWKFCAAGHIFTQALPMFALFALRHPWLRLAEGLVYVIGIFLLQEVMGFWNPPWILLAAFFVDFDFFLAKILKLRADFRTPMPRRHSVGVLAYALAFVAANLAAILFRLDDYGLNRAYPLSSMTFYSNVAASRPFKEHMHYPFVYTELELERDEQRQKWFCYPGVSSWNTLPLAGPSAVKLDRQIGAMRAVVQDLKNKPEDLAADCNGTVIDVKNFDAIDLYESILDIPPYPAPIEAFEVGFRALQARHDHRRKRIISAAAEVLPSLSSVTIEVRSAGLDVDHYDILLANDPWKNYKVGPLLETKGAWEDASFHLDRDVYAALSPGWYPITVRVTERSGAKYDFFGGVLYRPAPPPPLGKKAKCRGWRAQFGLCRAPGA
jgi:hypothetical protein